MSAKSELVEKLKNKKYRSAYIRSQINVGIPMQIKFLRENLGWTQGALGKKAGMKQPRISAMERPGEVRFNIETLIRLASAFDVGLVVRFASYSEMLRLESQFNPNTFTIPSFDRDVALRHQELAAAYIPAFGISEEVSFLVGDRPADYTWQAADNGIQGYQFGSLPMLPAPQTEVVASVCQ
jgi:transcriptional regulator with XRE-family HTH domain